MTSSNAHSNENLLLINLLFTQNKTHTWELLSLFENVKKAENWIRNLSINVDAEEANAQENFSFQQQKRLQQKKIPQIRKKMSKRENKIGRDQMMWCYRLTMSVGLCFWPG